MRMLKKIVCMYVKGQTYWHGQLDTGTDLTIEVLIRNIVGLG